MFHTGAPVGNPFQNFMIRTDNYFRPLISPDVIRGRLSRSKYFLIAFSPPRIFPLFSPMIASAAYEYKS